MTGTRSSVRFWHQGSIWTLDSIDPTRTVLEWLREDRGLTGSKEGCAEGDCGACTALMAHLRGGELVVQPVNTCITLLPMLEGSALLTVEDLRGSDGALHPIQRAMVDCHGSQCGFCTPGFVMALAVLYHETSTPSHQEILDQLAGNLCRCTGYGPIIEAAKRMGKIEPRVEIIPEALPAKLEAIRSKECLAGIGPDGPWFAPKTVDDLARLLELHPQATLVAGATDVGLWVTKQLRTFYCLIFLHLIEELAVIRTTEPGIEIGAMVTHAQARAALAEYSDDLDELLRRFGSEQVRSRGTIGGNIANGSPIGDLSPALIAVGARLRLRQGHQRREIPLDEFFIAYGKQDRRPGEFVEAIILPSKTADWHLHIHKVSKRFDQDISAVCGAFGLKIAGGIVEEARIAFGGMAGTPIRARQTEAVLVGQPWTEVSVRKAMIVLENEFEPLSDQRGSARYRRIVARNLLWKVWLERVDQSSHLSLARQKQQAVHA